jgi:beta-lactamase regulating signal transducer with metallopeptidase domain
MNDPGLAMVVNHLWQSTLFAAAIWGLARLLRANSARVRYALWFAASMKFLLPFALLAALGTQMRWQSPGTDPGIEAPAIVELIGDFTAPMAGVIPYPHWKSPVGTFPDETLVMLTVLGVWLIGALFVWARWLVRWIQIRGTLRRSAVMAHIDFPAPVRATAARIEPGVVGIFRPQLLLPEGIEQCLSPGQLAAVLAHERCHLHRRDNLTASLHMVAETLFWFFPPVWWIGARLIEERERACDEQVVREGHPVQSYAEGILNVCEHYIASRLTCVSGVSGADLRERVQNIVRRTLGEKMGVRRKLMLAATACCAVATPIAAGMISGNTLQMLLSLGPGGTLLFDYMRLQDAATELQSAAVRDKDVSKWTCPAYTSAEVALRQEVMTRNVARLSPRDEDALLYAVAANSVADVQRLLAGGATWKGKGFLMPRSPMHVAAQFSDPPVLDALAAAGYAVDSWSEVLGEGESGVSARTPLMVAITAGRKANAYWFIEHGANAGATNRKSGSSPLILALASCRDNDLVARLIQAGAVPDARALRIADNFGLDLRTNPAQPAPPLQSWRAPTPGAQVSADFDGDGKPDQAMLLLAIDGKTEGLFLRLSHAPEKWIRAAASRPAKSRDELQMEISIEAPGRYATACSKGYGKSCQEGEPAAVTLAQPGIRFSQPESASLIVYWDEAAQAVKQVWTSD